MVEDWFSPAEISFNREQVIWIISNIDEIELGRWPPDFKYTGYTGSKKGKRFGPAFFEVPCAISAEIKRRLDFTGKDGSILYWQIKAGVTVFEVLQQEAKDALNFMSLFDFRKRPKYYEWKKWRKYYFKQKLLPKGSKNNRKAGQR